MDTRLSAIILTGGASSRFGSDKSQALIGQHSLIEHLLMTLPSKMEIVVVGPQLQMTSRSVKCTQEDPLGGGPVAAIHAGLELIETEFVAVVATDMPFASQILEVLMDNFPNLEDATIPVDEHGIQQPLCALYKTEALSRALGQLGTVQGQAVRRVIDNLTVKELSLQPNLRRILLDVDTPSDLERAISLNNEPKE